MKHWQMEWRREIWVKSLSSIKNHSLEIVGTKYWVFRCSTYEVKAISNYSSINFSNFAYFEKCILEFTSELFDVLFTFSAIVKEITTQLPHDRDNYDDTGNFWMYRSNQWIITIYLSFGWDDFSGEGNSFILGADHSHHFLILCELKSCYSLETFLQMRLYS